MSIREAAIDHAQEMTSDLSDGDCPCCGMGLVRRDGDAEGVAFDCHVCGAGFAQTDTELIFDCTCGRLQCGKCVSGSIVKRGDKMECNNCGESDVKTVGGGGSPNFENLDHALAILKGLRTDGHECPCCGEKYTIDHIPGARMGWRCRECGASALKDEVGEFLVNCGCDDQPHCGACGSDLITVEEDLDETEFECETCDLEYEFAKPA